MRNRKNNELIVGFKAHRHIWWGDFDCKSSLAIRTTAMDKDKKGRSYVTQRCGSWVWRATAKIDVDMWKLCLIMDYLFTCGAKKKSVLVTIHKRRFSWRGLIWSYKETPEKVWIQGVRNIGKVLRCAMEELQELAWLRKLTNGITWTSLIGKVNKWNYMD